MQLAGDMPGAAEPGRAWRAWRDGNADRHSAAVRDADSLEPPTGSDDLPEGDVGAADVHLSRLALQIGAPLPQCARLDFDIQRVGHRRGPDQHFATEGGTSLLAVRDLL